MSTFYVTALLQRESLRFQYRYGTLIGQSEREAVMTGQLGILKRLVGQSLREFLNECKCGSTRTRSNHDFKLRPRAVRTNYFKFSFFNRYVMDWNNIPNSVMHALSLSSFKIRLSHYLYT